MSRKDDFRHRVDITYEMVKRKYSNIKFPCNDSSEIV